MNIYKKFKKTSFFEVFEVVVQLSKLVCVYYVIYLLQAILNILERKL